MPDTPLAPQGLHEAARRQLAADRVSAQPPGRRRIAATACWRFPIFSQSFVYQELTQLLHRGYDVKFLYSELDSSHPLPEQFSVLWQQRRQMFLSEDVWEEDFQYFRSQMPEKVEALIDMLCDTSGLSREQLTRHHHFRLSFPFTRTVEAFQPDYLHSYFFYEGSLFTFVASYLLEIPRGVSCYSDHTLDDYDLKAVQLQLWHSDLVIATSGRIKSELLNLAPGVDPDRIVVKPNAINAQRFPLVAREEPGAGQPFRLVCVSRFDPKKGLTYLVRALRLLRDRGLNVELHVVGGVDPDQKGSAEYGRRLEADIASLNIAPWVHLEGRRPEPEVRRFLEEAHLFIAPFVELPGGDKDGIPTTILEAMATGLPVVATNAGSIAEVIRDGIDGVIVPQRRPDALARAVEDLIGDPRRRARLCATAAVRARSEFDVAICEQRFHSALERLLNLNKDAQSRPTRGAIEPDPPFPASMRLAVESRHPLELPAVTVESVLSNGVGSNLPLLGAIEGALHASIIVVTFNNLVFNRLCLESLIANTRSLKYEIVVVDNASTDGTQEYLQLLAARAPQVRAVFNASNVGFAPAVNQGLAMAQSDLLVLLNNDTIVPEQWLTRLLGHLDDSAVGLVGPVTNRAGNEAQIEVPYKTYAELAAFARAHTRAHQGESFDIRTLTMFCAAMRRDVYEQVGPLDERFEVGLFEDDDYSMRVREAGYLVRCAEDAFVHHFGQASFGHLAPDGRYGALFHANKQRWEEKWGARWAPHQARQKPAYAALVEEIRAMIGATLPSDAVCAVISRGDSALLDLSGRRGRHFPQTDTGEYAGHYPANSAEAITMLERARSDGAQFLVVPEPALWWLDHYGEFAEYLRTRFRFISPQPAMCAIVHLSDRPGS